MKRILIVDDVNGWVRFHKTNLDYIGQFSIDTANSAINALSKIEVSIDNVYDVIFTDLQMESNFFPLLAGEWLIKQIKMFDEYKNTRVVIISASPEISLIAKKYNVEFISKYDVRNADAEIYRQFVE